MLVVIIEIWTTLKCIVHIYTCLCNSCWSLRSLPIIHFFLDISLECTCSFLHGMINILSKLPTYLKYIKILCIKDIEILRVVFLFQLIAVFMILNYINFAKFRWNSFKTWMHLQNVLLMKVFTVIWKSYIRFEGCFQIKNIINDLKINITKTTHVHRITWGWRYHTLILLINNRNCNIRGSWNFKGLYRL